MLSIQAKEQTFCFITFKCFTWLLDHCSTDLMLAFLKIGFLSATFPERPSKWSVVKRSLMDSFCHFIQEVFIWPLVTTLTTSCLACWVVQFDGTAWLNAGLCHKYTFYYMDLTMPPKNHAVFWTSSRFIWKVQGQLPGLNGSSTDLNWYFIWETSQILFVRHFDDENNDICCVIEQSNMYPSTQEVIFR